VLELPAGNYVADWVDPSTGSVLGTEKFAHGGGQHAASTPKHSVDMALRIKRQAGDASAVKQ
jgi:hypothetical protein